PDDLVPWVEENLPREAPDPEHGLAAFGMLAEGERCLQRARRYRTYGLWSYASEILTGGVGTALRDAPGPVPASLRFPQYLGDMGRSRVSRASRDAIAAKIGARCHVSRRKARDDFLPFLDGLFDRVGASPTPLPVRELQLTPGEVGYLARMPLDSAAIARLFEPDPEPEPLPKGEAPGEPLGEPPPQEDTEPTGSPGPMPPAGESGATPPTRKRIQRSLGEFTGEVP
ncbi:replication factor C large subunit, partial [mine drainage metagenome]